MFLVVWREESSNVFCVAIKLSELCKWFLQLTGTCTAGINAGCGLQVRVPEDRLHGPPIGVSWRVLASSWAGIVACNLLQEINERIQMQLCESKNTAWFLQYICWVDQFVWQFPWTYATDQNNIAVFCVGAFLKLISYQAVQLFA